MMPKSLSKRLRTSLKNTCKMFLPKSDSGGKNGADRPRIDLVTGGRSADPRASVERGKRRMTNVIRLSNIKA